MFTFNNFDIADDTYTTMLDIIAKRNVKTITKWYQYPLLMSFLQTKLKGIIHGGAMIDIESMLNSEEYDYYPPKLNDVIYELIHKKVDPSLLKNYEQCTEGFDLLKTINARCKSIDPSHRRKIFHDFIHEAVVPRDCDAMADFLEIFDYYFKDVNFSNLGDLIY